MIHRLKYNSENIDMIYNSLSNLLSQGKPKDFEIKIDGLTVVHRTNRLNKFSLYRKSMYETTNEVTFLIYYGKSRVNDKYILSRQLIPIKSPITIQAEVDRIVKEKQHEQEFKRLKEVEVYHKKKIKNLKLKIEALETHKTNDLKVILSEMSKLISTNPNKSLDAETQQIVDLITFYKSKYDKVIFEEALAIGLTLVENSDLIKDVKQFIHKKKGEQENEKEQK